LIAEEGQPAKRVHPIIQILVWAHMALIICWSLPAPPPALQNGSVRASPNTVVQNPVSWLLLGNWKLKTSPPVQNYMLTFSQWQYWDMFAPDPSSLDIWLDAEVTMADGTIKTVPYPRMSQMSIPVKYFHERYRKYVERLNGEEYSYKWPAFARWMARRAWTDPKNPPKEARLRRHWRDIRPYPEATPPEYSMFIFHVEAFEEGELERGGV
jgi:hypothetical protein